MRYWWLLIALLVALGVLAKVVGAGAAERVRGAWGPLDPYAASGGSLVSNNWAYSTEGVGALLPATSPVTRVTGLAFAPGRSELAVCGEDQTGAYGVWLVQAEPLVQARARAMQAWEDANEHMAPPTYVENPAPPRLVWTAPAGTALHGPLWWAPSGDRVAVPASGSVSGLAVVDIGTGQATWALQGSVLDAAWSPAGDRLAVVTSRGDCDRRLVVLRPELEGEATPLGAGGWNLRWSVDGKTLRWLAPLTETAWAELEWSGGQAAQIGTKPARPEGTQWSPDGQLCAALVGEGDAKQVVLYPASSAQGQPVPLPGLRVQRLLGWSPDSNLLLVQANLGFVLLLTARPPDPGALLAVTDQAPERVVSRMRARMGGDPEAPEVPADSITLTRARKERGEVTSFPLNAEAGPPAWSSDGTLLAYVSTWGKDPNLAPRYIAEEGTKGAGRLSLLRCTRQYVGLDPTQRARIERATVTSNVRNIAMALNMYLADYEAFPPSVDQAAGMKSIDDYVRNTDLFMRPGTRDEPVVTWLFTPGLRTRDLGDFASTRIAIIDYHPDFSVIAYADGHVETVEKGRR